MSTTTNLNLTINHPDSTEFSVFLEKIDDNFRKIDTFSGDIYGRSGTITISVSDWSNKTYVVNLIDMGNDDCVICQPKGRANKTVADNAGLVLEEVSGTTLTFTVSKLPTNSIVLDYFISRGKN